MKIQILSIAALSVLAACGQSQPTSVVSRDGDAPAGQVADGSKSLMKRKPVTEIHEHDAAVPLNFIILGDAGTQDEVQNNLGQVIAELCAAKTTADVPGCRFALAAGDNIYMVGAASPEDPQFLTAFETPYQPLEIPFYLVLGNHDNGATGTVTQQGDNQVEYAYKADRPSDKWHMPARYYTQRYGSVFELFALDSDTIDFPTDDPAGYDGPTQRAFAAEAVALSPARWKFSMTHYNYISNGNYGDGSPTFKGAMEEAVCDRVQFHIQGHEHDLRWLSPVETCGRTEFIVSGAGGRMETRPATNLGFAERKGQNGTSDYRGSAGFMWASILGDTLTVEWYGDTVTGEGAAKVIERFVINRADLGFTD